MVCHYVSFNDCCMTGHAVDLSQSEVLHCHQHTTTPPLAACWRAGTSSTTRQSWTGSEEPYQKCMRRSWTDGQVSTCHLVFCFFFLLYIGFVSIVNNLTQHWCAWDHVACMCMGTPRTDWHVSMCAGVEWSYLPCILAFNIHLTVL